MTTKVHPRQAKPIRSMSIGKTFIERARASWGRLTVQQQNTCKLMALGKGRASIAAHLAISEKTVDVHLASIYERLNLNRGEVPLFTLAALGIVEPFTI